MSATNIFYRIPSQRGTRVVTITGSECTLHQFCDYIIDSEGLNRNDFIIASGTKVFRPNSCSLQTINLQNNSHVDILIPLLGGKGGFGSLLRAIGAQIEKTTNRDACRDLSGRRLRDIKREDELKKLIALQEKLQEERERRKQEKLEKLKRTNEASLEGKSIQELVSMFEDQEYNKRRLELGDIIKVAVDKGIINFKKRQQEEKEAGGQNRNKKLRLEESLEEKSNVDLDDITEKQVLSDGLSESIESTIPESKNVKSIAKCCQTKKNDLWLGLEDEDEDI